MALEIGDRLGPYEIVGMLGSGGMAEVYKARDPRVDRIVAIKVSAEALTARSEREARAVAALNHPNICHLYDVGPNYLVLEYVDGLPVAPTGSVRKLLDLAVQLADGMAAAHAAGFVHRDLKPSNVLVTRDGRLKILDFGLAKSVAPTDGPAPTVTGTGLVAGTVAYMSPEQARGNAELDARSDQFTFGLMLYELATGKRAFERPTGVETLMAIMRDDAEPLPATLPAPLRWIIERCLAKEPEHRYESSRDLYLELKSVREHLTDASAIRPAIENVTARSSRRATFLLAAGIAAGAVAALLTMLLAGSREAPSPQLRYTPLSFEQGGQIVPVWSPDSRAVAYMLLRRGTDPQEIDVRYLDLPVANTLTTRNPAFPRQWTTKGEVLFADPLRNGELWSVSAVGGTPELALANPEGTISSPPMHAVARDGSAAAAFLLAQDGEWGVWISSPFGSPYKKYEPSPFAARMIFNSPVLEFSPDGKQLLLLLSRGRGEGGELWLLPLGTHAPRRIPQSQQTIGAFSWLPDNRHIVTSAVGDFGLHVVDTVSGKSRILSSGTADQLVPSVSPDGHKVAFVEQHPNFDIVALDLATAAVTRVIAT
ncbi:MAG TPA: protein kinase, partial [Gammaproteobacteria bacterium]|nr:protein kinase [Gammaproteobacteria bacterium]